MTENPLLSSFNTLYDTFPFSKVKPKDFRECIPLLINETEKSILEIANNSEEATFLNTLHQLEQNGTRLSRVTAAFFNLNSAETSSEIQEIAQSIAPLLSEHKNNILLNKKLFDRVKKVFDNKDNEDLDDEAVMLLENTYKSFVRNGALLSDSEKEKLRNLDSQLSKLSLQFGENVLADSNAYQLHIDSIERLEGLPENVIETAANLAVKENKSGWILTLDYPCYIPTMTYAKDRKLRKELALAFGKKGFKNNENNNEAIVLQISQLRKERALLLGYKSHADLVLEERMAKTPETVLSFLEELNRKAFPQAQKEIEKLKDLAKSDGVLEFQKWDTAYYSEIMKKSLFNIDDETLKPYFEVNKTLEGVFKVSEILFDLEFEINNEIDVYHEDVQTFIVKDKNSKDFIAVLYVDLFPREGKRNGAWMTSFKNQSNIDNKNNRPHISIVCNFTRPSKQNPSLLTFNEVTTLFHEFGHALHGMLANTKYGSLSGTSVAWDFVELPSQIMENWCFEKEALELFAQHYETGENIPLEWIEKIKDSANFMQGYQTIRQVNFGLLDMSWHHEDSKKDNVKSHETNVFNKNKLLPDIDENCMSTSFSHIFQGGYSAGYYSYKWAEVLDADAFELFKEKGVFNKETALSFKDNILSKGGTIKADLLYEKFRGRKPKVEALLKRAGLIN